MNFNFRQWLNEEILQHNNLAQLFKSSGLEEQGAIKAMNSHSAGILHIEDYLKQPPGKRAGAGGIALGLTDEAFLYDLISYLSKVENWKEAYPRLTGSGEANTDDFMEKLTTQSKPIVFFVPSHVTSHNGVTSEEVEWYMKNPDKMKNTYFVFGLYDMVNKDVWEKYLLPREPNDLPIMTGVLNNPKGHFIKGGKPHNAAPNSPEMNKELQALKAQGDEAGDEPLDSYLTRMDKLQDVPPRYPTKKAKWNYRP